MKTRKRTKVPVAELGIALVSAGLLVLLSYTFYTRLQHKAMVGGAAQSAIAEDVSSAPKIKVVDDLDKAISTLAGINPGEDEDSLQLDDELDDF